MSFENYLYGSLFTISVAFIAIAAIMDKLIYGINDTWWFVGGAVMVCTLAATYFFFIDYFLDYKKRGAR